MAKAKVVFLVFLVLLVGPQIFGQSEEATKILTQTSEGVILLVAYDENKSEIGRGSGFAIANEVIVTNYHFISKAFAVEGMSAKKKNIKVEGILAVDKNFDIALLKVKGKLPALPYGNFNELKEGSPIFAVGADEADEIAVSEGKAKSFYDLGSGQRIADAILTAASSYKGGPICDPNGQVAGIFVIVDRGVKFIVPSDVFKNLSPQPKATEFKKWAHEDYLATFEGAYLAGRAASLLDELGSAQKYLEAVIKLDPNLLDAQALLASVYGRQRNYAAAVTAYKKVTELDPSRAEAHYNLGMILMKMQRASEAAPEIEKAISLQIDNKEAYFHLGTVYESLQNFSKAAEAYENFVKTDHQNVWAGYFNLGMIRLRMEQYDKAVAALEEAKKNQSQDVKVNESLAQAYQKAGQLEKAEETLEMLAQLAPDAAMSYFSQIIRMYDEAGQQAKAIEPAKKMVELNPKSEVAVYNLGIMYQKLDRFEEAIEAFKQALVVRPNYEYAYNNIGFSYSRLKKYKESIEAFKKYVELVPDDADGWFNIGINYMLLKDFRSALEPLKKSVSLRPGNGPALYNLAITYLNLNDNYSARDVYKDLVSVDPSLAERLKKHLR
jgi:tetratricopeptide (TPR) repeat protein